MKKFTVALTALCLFVMGLCLTPVQAAEKKETVEQPAAVTEPAAPAGTSIFNRKKIAYVMYDGTGEATTTMNQVWKRQVRQAYPRAKYEFLDDPKAAAAAAEVLGQNGGLGYPVDKMIMSQIGEKAGADVVALLVVREMEQFYIQPWAIGWDDDGPDMLVRTYSSADMYIYNKDRDKFLQKKLRKVETVDQALAVAPEVEIRNAFSNLAMKMEGKEQI